MFPSIFYLIFL